MSFNSPESLPSPMSSALIQEEEQGGEEEKWHTTTLRRPNIALETPSNKAPGDPPHPL